MNKVKQTTTFIGKMFGILLLLMFAMPVLALESTFDVAMGDEVLKRGVTVYGVVVDKKTAEPLIGASVAVWKGDKMVTGVSTDIEGAFRLVSEMEEFELRISYIGYKEVVMNSKSRKLEAMRIELEEDSNTLNDVVITGFVSKNKETFTGSATEITGMELRQVSGTNLIGAISALTPGMAMVQNTSQGSNPNHTPELVLRGMSSFSNSGQQVNQPTIILDGTEISMQDLYDLDINEVEKITVLKDASATALYGVSQFLKVQSVYSTTLLVICSSLCLVTIMCCHLWKNSSMSVLQVFIMQKVCWIQTVCLCSISLMNCITNVIN